MTTVDRVKAACKSKKIAISTLERELGYSNGYIGKLKKGVLPDDRLVDIAKFLGVSVSYLTGWDDAVLELNAAGLSKIDIAKEMGVPVRDIEKILSGNDAHSAGAAAKIVRVASLLSDQKEKPTLQAEGERIPGYSKLSDTNKAIVDSMIAQLLAAQLED